MSYFDKDKRFDELFDDWFDNDFMAWLARERHWAENAPGSGPNTYLRGVAQAYEWVDEKIEGAILKMREQVDREFEEWKKEEADEEGGNG